MKQILLIVITSLFFGAAIHAQSPGIIIRPGGGAGVTPLNPNGDGFSSATTSGFSSSDITQSEIQYKIIPPPFLEF